MNMYFHTENFALLSYTGWPTSRALCFNDRFFDQCVKSILRSENSKRDHHYCNFPIHHYMSLKLGLELKSQ